MLVTQQREAVTWGGRPPAGQGERPRKTPALPHLDLGLPDSRTGRDKCLCRTSPGCGTLSRQHEQTDRPAGTEALRVNVKGTQQALAGVVQLM